MTNRKADNLLLFKSIVDSNSISLAAKVSNISISQASKRMSHLESILGIQLLQRTTRKLSLTPAGEVLYKKMEAIKNQIDEAWHSMLEFSNEPKGKLHVASTTYFGLNDLMHFTKEFKQEHPEIIVDLKLFNKEDQLDEASYDVSFESHKVGPNQSIPDTKLATKKVRSEKMVYVASRQYLEEFGLPVHPEELGKHKCLAINNTKAKKQWTFFNGQTPFRQNVEVVFETNNFESLHRAAQAGMGIAQVPQSLLESNDDLVVLFEQYSLEKLDTYAYFNNSELISKKVDLFLKNLEKQPQTAH